MPQYIPLTNIFKLASIGSQLRADFMVLYYSHKAYLTLSSFQENKTKLFFFFLIQHLTTSYLYNSVLYCNTRDENILKNLFV